MTSSEELGLVSAGDLNAHHLRHIVRVETGAKSADGNRPGVLQGALVEIVHGIGEDGWPVARLTVALLQQSDNASVTVDGHHEVRIVANP